MSFNFSLFPCALEKDSVQTDTIKKTCTQTKNKSAQFNNIKDNTQCNPLDPDTKEHIS